MREGDLVSSFHWESQFEIFSVLLPCKRSQFLSHHPAWALESWQCRQALRALKEQLARGTVRLSDALEWTVPSEDVFRATRGSLERRHQCAFFARRRAKLTPRPTNAVWTPSQLPEDGRFGTIDDAGCLCSPVQLPEEVLPSVPEIAPRPFPTPKTRGKAAGAQPRRGRRAGAKAGAARRNSSPAPRMICAAFTPV